jgi:hypothetical protein
MHAAMPVLFITVMEGVRHLIRQWVGLATGTRREKIPTTRWLLAPISTLLLWRRTVLWHVTAYRQGLALEYEHLLAISQLQQTHGRWGWRWRAPLADRIALRLHPAETTVTQLRAVPQDAASAATESAVETASTPSWADRELLDAAREIIADADRRGIRLSRDNLGRRLRTRGLSIANERLGELADAARNGHRLPGV